MDKEQTLDDVINEALGVGEDLYAKVKHLSPIGMGYAIEELLRLITDNVNSDDVCALAEMVDSTAWSMRVIAMKMKIDRLRS